MIRYCIHVYVVLLKKWCTDCQYLCLQEEQPEKNVSNVGLLNHSVVVVKCGCKLVHSVVKLKILTFWMLVFCQSNITFFTVLFYWNSNTVHISFTSLHLKLLCCRVSSLQENEACFWWSCQRSKHGQEGMMSCIKLSNGNITGRIMTHCIICYIIDVSKIKQSRIMVL